jgi:hypothetical protein
MMSKANKVYNKVCNKYYGYTNLSEQQIDEITKHVKMTSSIFDDINDIDEYAKTKGHTVEDNLNSSFYEMYQSAQTQLHEVKDEVKNALIDEITKHVKMTSSTFDDINDIDEYVKTKGHTVEDNLNSSFHEMYQSAQTQLHEVENEVKDALIDEFNPCNNVYCYATAAVTAILLAIQFMNSYDNEVSYHGFVPSGH